MSWTHPPALGTRGAGVTAHALLSTSCTCQSLLIASSTHADIHCLDVTQGEGWDAGIVGFLDNSMGAISKVEDEEASRNHYQVS